MRNAIVEVAAISIAAEHTVRNVQVDIQYSPDMLVLPHYKKLKRRPQHSKVLEASTKRFSLHDAL